MAEAISARRTTIDASHRRWAVRLWGRVATRGGAPLDTSDRIGTPENIEFSYFGAGPFVRFLAFSVDTLVWLFGFFALWLLVAILFGFASTYLIRIGLGELVDSLSEMASGLFLLSLFLTYWMMWGLCETFFNGRTLGKFLFRLRVVTIEGHPIRGWQAMIRTIVRSIDVMPLAPPMLISGTFFGEEAGRNLLTGELEPPFFILPTGLLGLLVMSFAPRFRRIGDLVSGTCVVYEHRGWRPGLAVLEDPRTAALAELIPPGFRVRRELARAVSSYVHKRRYLSIQRRREIAAHVAEPLIRQFGLLPDTGYDLLMCALYHRTFVVARSDETAARAARPSAAESIPPPMPTAMPMTTPAETPMPPATAIPEVAVAAAVAAADRGPRVDGSATGSMTAGQEGER
ncbi:MAG TPA: RDD family protein [Pirellulaceae bacterium]|nr:RDD family protein [Pirellulaceae bacterium]